MAAPVFTDRLLDLPPGRYRLKATMEHYALPASADLVLKWCRKDRPTASFRFVLC